MMRILGLGFTLLGMMALPLLLYGMAHGADVTVPADVTITWQHPGAVGLAGFRVYVGGVKRAEIANPAAREWRGTMEVGASDVYTMKAFGVFGTESPASPGYALVIPPIAPPTITGVGLVGTGGGGVSQ